MARVKLYRPGGRLLAVATVACVGLVSVVLTAQAGVAATATTVLAQPSVRSVSCEQGINEDATTPPAGFKPLAADAVTLAAYGFPPRPSNPGDLKIWRHYVTSTIHHDLSCKLRPTNRRSVLVPTQVPGQVQPATTEVPSTNWAGNVATGRTYTDVEAAWHVPAAGGSSQDAGTSSSSWVGIGQGSSPSRPLMQAGSESDGGSPSPATPYLWLEVVPGMPQSYFVSNIYAGDLLYVHIHYANNSVGFHFVDENTDYDASVLVTPAAGQTIAPDGTAEWVFERPEQNIGGNTVILTRLAKATTTFTTANGAGTSFGWIALGSLSHYYQNMSDCSSVGSSAQELASPGSISNGTQFTDKWLNYGHVSVVLNNKC